ncbi:glucoamylase family protein [Alteromonas sp. M12]|uniref:GH36-type glycosyl hydrolase domain-containing protein n=1 Tax=Alteromonas sp. M12 TaxID=3135644 RepID=UPI00319E1552
MSNLIYFLFGSACSEPPWDSLLPVREELFGIERLEQHAVTLAAAQIVAKSTPRGVPLQIRLKQNASVLLNAYRASAKELEAGHIVVPAAEWLLDNYHLVEQQIREVKEDLPPSFYRQLPKLSVGPFAGYPRVFGIAWAYVAHTDSHFDPDNLCRFIQAYQSVQPLTIGELWAIAITLRIVLIENLRRLADQFTVGRLARADADQLTDRLLVSGCAHSVLAEDIATRSSGPLSEPFAAQLAKRLRDQDPKTTPALEWLEQRLNAQELTVEAVVQRSQLRQGASNVTIRNVITSMRLISDIDWTELFERVSLVDKRLSEDSKFSELDFATRNLYRSAIEQLARGSLFSELEVAELALQTAEEASKNAENEREAERLGDPGYCLIEQGRRSFERSLKFKPKLGLWLSRLHIRIGLSGYIASILISALTLVLLSIYAFGFSQLPLSWLVLITALGFIPATEISTAIVNRSVTWRLGSRVLAGLELKSGVPAALRTLVVVPTLLTNEDDILEQVEQLEVHFLGGIDGHLSFALLVDGVDADQEVLDSDAPLLAKASAKINELNQRYGPGPTGKRFLLLYRHRLFNPSENKWMGWERKRGKLHELNRLLRGATDTSFMSSVGCMTDLPTNVRYVITLDADTRLPRDTAQRLIGKMGHPLNRPRLNPDTQRIEAGYGIIQPRVTPSLSVGTEGSFYQRVFSNPGGMDPYAAAISDVYQDLFGEGSYTGKGIYDIDAFESSLAGRVQKNTLLSHDLFEGIFARAALVSDIEVVEEFPARYDVLAKRQHRWIRGDWQLLPWIFARFTGVKSVSHIGRWKMLDNLRRSLVGPLTLLALLLSWLLPLSLAVISTALLLATMIIPAFIPSVFSLTPHKSSVNLANHLRMWTGDLRNAGAQVLFNLAFLPDHSWRTIDAISRTLLRVFFSHRGLLEWTSTAQSNGHPRLSLVGFYRTMWTGTVVSQVICLGLLVLAPTSWPLIVPFALLWLLAPLFAFFSSRSQPSALGQDTDQFSGELRLTARQTWRYFETFVTAQDNMLPPDNFQEEPQAVIAHRTSPTNIGLYLLSAVCARDFGWAGLQETIARLEVTFKTLKGLPRYKGHFYNWYSTQTLQVLLPAYVSSVDSGNLAGHLIALANACDEWQEQPMHNCISTGIQDNLKLLLEVTHPTTSNNSRPNQLLNTLITDISVLINGSQNIEVFAPTVLELTKKAQKLVNQQLSSDNQLYVTEVCFWLGSIGKLVTQQLLDQQALAKPEARNILIQRLYTLANTARYMAHEMDFAFLLDPERNLISIGYSLAENCLDPSCYDLLASEARLASLFAIAKGDVVTKHWFRLGRTATPLGNGSALISWSGSMFEYLMPSLVMRAPLGSLLEQTNCLVVERQQQYGHQLGIPWGISESSFNARDIELTYQYSNFGVPGLGLKRGLSENTVIAPYATGLATMVDPKAAVENYRRLEKMGARGTFGFYEALDFTPARLPLGADVAIVRSFMAHHQGMTIVAILNCLHKGLMRSRFHREPKIQACELLLQEKMPRNIAIGHPRAEEVKGSNSVQASEANTVRRLSATSNEVPLTHLLSNGRYTVMLTTSGAGYSRWRDFAITRWNEDSTCDNNGSFILLRDIESGKCWSGTAQPFDVHGEFQPCLFAEDHAEFSMRQGNLSTKMEILVSGEDDGEVRRLSVTNNGHFCHEVEVTSYAELVLAEAANDNAHPAFAKMFVQTEFMPEFGALVATRRKRSANDTDIWAAHFAIVEGEISAIPQYETSRAEFIGRGNTVASAAAMGITELSAGKQLSNTVGCVLDPIFALRFQLKVPPGAVVRVVYWTVVAASRAELLELIDRHNDLSAYDRAKTLAWTQAQVQLRYLGIKDAEVADFQRLAAPIIYADARFRASSQAIVRGMACQSELWTLSISGDLPIVLLRIDDIEDMAEVKQLLRAHEYWCMKGLAVDLVIINERTASYIQDLQNALDIAVRSSQSRPRFHKNIVGDQLNCSVHVLRADLIPSDTRKLLNAVARVVLIARHGLINKQVKLRTNEQTKDLISGAKPYHQIKNKSNDSQSDIEHRPELEFFNGMGGFADNGKEYVIYLENGQQTAAPWINVIANPNFGFHVSEQGSGYTWSENSRENQLTAWSNDAISDPSGEIIYIRDEQSLQLYTATAQPLHDNGKYVARHGFGYSQFEHQVDGLALNLLQYVPLQDSIKISRLSIRNDSGRARRLSVTAYTEWVLGTTRKQTGPYISSKLDPSTQAILLRNRWGMAFPERVAFADMGGKQTLWTTDRTEFIGRRGHKSAPQALLLKTPLTGTTGAGYDPCTALQQVIELADGESIECVVFIGQSANEQQALELINRYRQTDLNVVLDEVRQHWQSLLTAVQVKTPDRSMDIMLNGWLLYQTLACRIWARSSFYQASGAYGFRDQLQDGMALTFSRPDMTRSHILRAAARQFLEGDVQHWWLPHSGQGVRTHITDDRAWLALATTNYITTSGDHTILDEMVPFLDGPLLNAGQHDAFFKPEVTDESASLYEHCALGLEQSISLTGEHGLPLMGTGDWNDGMNLVGAQGKGESVWLGWLLIYTIDSFVVHALARGNEKDRLRGIRWQGHAKQLRENIDKHAWDGEWYRRATFDDGTWLGSNDNDECKIDSIAQSWAVLAKGTDTQRVASAMSQVEQNLILQQDGLALLFTPAFDHSVNNPGYIKGYPPGLRENGGQYSHAAMWLIFAFSQQGESKKACDLFNMLNPINHTSTPKDIERYKVEPYVVAADIYSVSPYIGRGGWTWYTGAAGWMYRAGIEAILGIRREGKTLIIQPCIPTKWPGFNASVKIESSHFDINVNNTPPLANNTLKSELDGVLLVNSKRRVDVALDGEVHNVKIWAIAPSTTGKDKA